LNLVEDVQYLHLYLIALFLGLAFVDDAFENVTDPKMLFKNKLHSPMEVIKFKNSVLEKPLFWSSMSCKRNGGDDTAWSYAGGCGQVKGLGWWRGFRTPSLCYAIRRGAANVLNGLYFIPQVEQIILMVEASAIWEQTGLILGQSRPKVLQLSYLSRESRVDL
jgi:hypothetical protein